jgi:DNA-binding PadR family transcriptional regulator
MATLSPNTFSGPLRICSRSRQALCILLSLHRLEAQGWIAASWELSDKGKRAKYYRLTPRGRKQLAIEQSKWQAFSRAMGLILNPVEQEGQ